MNHELRLIHEALNGQLFGRENRCFACGPEHPHGLRMSFEIEGDSVITRLSPREDLQGAPSMMHGGLIATVADELAVWTMLGLRQKFGFTGKINARFRKPVRVNKDLFGRGKILNESSRMPQIEITLEQEGLICFSAQVFLVLLDKKDVEKMISGPIPESWKRFLP